jgi:hypothetical protein
LKTYFDILKITEGILKMKLKVDILNWHIENVCRLGKKRGGRPILVRLTSFMKKLEVLPSTRNLAGTKIQIEHYYRAKIQEMCIN